MNRRNFLSLLGMTAGGVLLDQAIPFNRVWSFPSKIVLAKHPFSLSVDDMRQLYIGPAIDAMVTEWEKDMAFLAGEQWVGSRTPIRVPILFTQRVLSGEVGNLVGVSINEETNLASHLTS